MTKNFSVVRHHRRRTKWSLAIIVLGFVAGLLAACNNDPEPSEAMVTAGQVIENPSNYVGKTVTVTGNVEELRGPRAFELESGVNLGELLVLGKDPFPQVPDAGGNRAYLVNDTVTVTGTVRTMVAAEIERELGWDLDPQIEAEFERKPVLVAQSLSFKPRPATASPSPTITPGAPMGMLAEVQQFVQFVSEKRPATGPQHEYTSTGITRLRAALAELASRTELRDQNVEQKLNLLTQRAEMLRSDPTSLKHADQTRQAFIAAAELMATIQQQRHPALSNQVAQVRQTAEAINAEQKLLDQTGKVETFFQRASDALQAMAR
jgi:hypothetical protein